MLAAPILADENARLRALHQMQLLDTPRDQHLDAVTRLARQLLNVPIAVVALVDHDRLWLKSSDGYEVTEVPRETSICAHVITQDSVFVVEDTKSDLRFFDSPVVTGSPHIRFYAGVPLNSSSGHHIGTLCIMDTVPRAFAEEQREILRNLALLAEQQLRSMAVATADELTQIANRRGFCRQARQMLAATCRAGRKSVLLLVDLNGFRMINDNYGHEVGDEALAQFAHCLALSCRQSDPVGRLGGDQFGVFMPNADADGARALVKRLVTEVAQLNSSGLVPMSLRFSVGLAVADPALDHDLDALLVQADAQLNANKRRQRQ